MGVLSAPRVSPQGTTFTTSLTTSDEIPGSPPMATPTRRLQLTLVSFRPAVPSPAVLDACEDTTAIAGEELSLVGAVCVFDHAGGGGVTLVGKILALDEPR